MTEKPNGGKPVRKTKKVSTGQIQAKVEEIQARVRRDLTSNEALLIVAVVATIGVLSAASYWLGRRSR